MNVLRVMGMGLSLGLQGRLILGFLSLLLMTIAGSYYVIRSSCQNMLAAVQSEASVEMAQTVARASEAPLRDGNVPELRHLGKGLLKNRGVMGVSFLDRNGQLLSFITPANENPPPNPTPASIEDGLSHLLQVRQRSSESLGHYAEVTVPVIRLNRSGGDEPATELLGYVSVGFVNHMLHQYLEVATSGLLVLGGAVIVLSLPLVWMLVNRIFLPVRQLMAATRLLAIGNDSARVETSRQDIIGTLARSFNYMATQIRLQKSELAEANDRLEESNRGLETRIEKRTALLQQLNKRLREEVAEKEDFVRAVSHDLNAPLRNISGMAAMLLLKYGSELNGDVVHRLERIQKNVAVQTELVNELLELSRIKTRRQRMEPVCVRMMIDELRELFDNDLRERGIELVIETRLPIVQCERTRLRQVFQNLIDNAIKYMGGSLLGRIAVGCEDRHGHLEFWVSDTGTGIAPEEAERIFHIFRRGASSAGTCGKGVGLASVKSIVETYRGRIWVASETDRGSTFHFTIEADWRWEKSEAAVA